MKSVFQQAVRFRTLGFVIIMLCVAYRAIFEDMIGTAILLIISIICDMQYYLSLMLTKIRTEQGGNYLLSYRIEKIA